MESSHHNYPSTSGAAQHDGEVYHTGGLAWTEQPWTGSRGEDYGTMRLFGMLKQYWECNPVYVLIGANEIDSISDCVMVILLSALVSSNCASPVQVFNTVRCLVNELYHELKPLHQSTWQQRTEVLTEAGYTHDIGEMATYLGELGELIVEKYGNDAQNLLPTDTTRDEAINTLRERLTEIKGLGPDGGDIVLGTIQHLMPIIAPFLDEQNRRTAERIGLGNDADAIFVALGAIPFRMAVLQDALRWLRLSGQQDEFIRGQ